MQLAFKYRVYPTAEQTSMLSRTFGCVRYVYNWGLALRRDAWKQEERSVGFAEACRELTVLKRQEETSWLKEVSCIPLQQTLRHLDRAFSNFFAKRAAYPCFKSKRSRQSAHFTRMGFTYSVGEDGRPVLKIAKMKRPLKVKWSRMPPGNPSSITISRDPAGRYHVCLLCEVTPEPLPPSPHAIGVDLGLTDLVVTSEGFKSGNPRHLERDLARLKRAQRSLSRKVKGSSNWYRQKRRIARLHARIKDCRADYLHKLSTKLIRENQTIALESLNVRGMVKNGRLARHIAGAAWSELVRQLEYKAALYGRTVVRVGQWEPTSKRCSACGAVVDQLPLSIRQWTCAGCGSTHDRDVNAAKNILAVGQTVRTSQGSDACGPSVSPALVSTSGAVRDEARIPCL